MAVGKKPRTYRQKARKDYLSLVKRRKPGNKIRRRGIRQQLQYVRRNLKHINEILDSSTAQAIPLSPKLLRKYWIIQTVYEQQNEMYQANKKQVENRIVSISQPHVRPIVRGKANKSAEFGAKISVSLTDTGVALVERFVNGKPQAGRVPEAVWINPPVKKEQEIALLRPEANCLKRPSSVIRQNRPTDMKIREIKSSQ